MSRLVPHLQTQSSCSLAKSQKAWGRRLIPIFTEIGEVYELAVLRDKETNRHRGCAFVTYYNRDDATSAVVEFHDKKKLSPTVGFMQVKPASDCKIFVANLPLDVKVETVNSMFAKFGAVDEVHLIRDHRGDFKGLRIRAVSIQVGCSHCDSAAQRVEKFERGHRESDRSFRRRPSVYLPNVQRQRIDAEW